MKKQYLIYCGFLLTVSLFGGCAAPVVIKDGTRLFDVGNVLQNTQYSKTPHKSTVVKFPACDTVGVVINVKSYLELKTFVGEAHIKVGVLRTEDFVYKEISSEIASLFKKAGINTILVQSENDPKLVEICALFCVGYHESIQPNMTPLLSGTSDLSIMNMGRDLSHIIQRFYSISVIDLRTGEESYYNDIGTAVNDISNRL